jgi:hypothetical protein
MDGLTSDNDSSGQEGKTPSELDAIIAYYQHKVKDSRMQAIIRRREETDTYIQMEAAYAFEVSTHITAMFITAMFRFPSDILSSGSEGGARLEHQLSYLSYNRRSTRGSGIGRSANAPCWYTDSSSVATCSRRGLRNVLPCTPSAAYSDAGSASPSAHQGISGQ